MLFFCINYKKGVNTRGSLYLVWGGGGPVEKSINSKLIFAIENSYIKMFVILKS